MIVLVLSIGGFGSSVFIILLHLQKIFLIFHRVDSQNGDGLRKNLGVGDVRF